MGLSYVLVIGLLIYALMQRRIRVKIEKDKTPIRLFGKDFYRPTGKTILDQFNNVSVVEITDPIYGKRRILSDLPEVTRTLLNWLGFDESIYLDESGPR
ncbi:hypothetical protein ACQYAD_04420 [Neobacillus sp. SM06]|uniref:hypothetical protein n=1 Tax=Neobacillus sp. SM06 TaxID=3422492 RepID=UPI003D2A8892